MKKVISLFIVTVMLCMTILTGCGGKNAGDTGNTDNTGDNAAANAPSYTIRVGHGAAENTGLHLGWVKFKEVVESKSNGRITVDIYPAQQLGGDRELIEGTQMGDITATSPSSSPLAPFAKEFFVLDIPFLFTDRDNAYSILDGEPGEQLLAALDGAGLKGVSFFENGFRNFTNSRNEVKAPEDVKGLKLRTMENPIHMDFWKRVGANPTPMAFGEVFTALQQKTIDAQENPFELIYTQKFYEVQDYITETQHIYSPYVVIFNKKFWDDLSDDDRALLEDAVKQATDENRAQSARLDTEAKEAIIAAGVQVTSLTAEEKQVWRDAMSPVLDLVRESAGDEIVDVFTKAANY